MTPFRKVDGYSAIDLLQYARDHREAALHLFEAAPEYFDSACYLSHLSIELLLKSIILHLIGEFPNSHQLSVLWNSIGEKGDRVELSADEERQLALLNSAWDIRYPHPKGPKPAGHAHRDALKSLWARITPQIPEALVNAFKERPVNLKGGRKFMVRAAAPADPAND